MIVKNEAKIITETLENISKYIDYYIISDTGSTDNTVEVITNFFDRIQIPGKIFHDTWEDFGMNRSKALEHAYNICDYIWIMDADDIVSGELVFPTLSADMYNFKFGSVITYVRPLLFKSSLKWRYRGILHEYVECIGHTAVSDIIPGNYHIESRRLGNRSADPEKYFKDAQILIRAVETGKDPDLKGRYMFYAGQSFFDYGKYEDAIQWYQKRVDEGGWIEETYYASLRIGLSMMNLNNKYNRSEIIAQLLKTFQYIEAYCNI
jgi:glycosyltransferase involved in cell wall biosynthesis